MIDLPMRLLLINDLAKYHNGGANRVVVETLEGLHRRGHTMGCIYEGGETELVPEIWARKVKFHQAPELIRAQLQAAIADFRPDVIQCHTTRIMGTYSDWVPRYASCQFIHDQTWYCSGGNRLSRDMVHCHRPHGMACLMWHLLEGCGGRSPMGNYRRWQQAQERQKIQMFSHLRLQVASDFMASGFQENGYAADRLDVIPLYCAPAATRAQTSEPGLMVLPSRLVHHKGVHVLIDAVSQIRDVPWRLVVPGEGPDRPALLAQIRQLGLTRRINLPGELHPNQVAEWYARAQLVVFPVLRAEPFGLIGVEALAYGKPIVAFAGGAVDEWLWPGETGIKVESKTATALAAALRELLVDPDRCSAMGAAARRRYPHFTLDAYLDRLLVSLERARAAKPVLAN